MGAGFRVNPPRTLCAFHPDIIELFRGVFGVPANHRIEYFPFFFPLDIKLMAFGFGGNELSAYTVVDHGVFIPAVNSGFQIVV